MASSRVRNITNKHLSYRYYYGAVTEYKRKITIKHLMYCRSGQQPCARKITNKHLSHRYYYWAATEYKRKITIKLLSYRLLRRRAAFPQKYKRSKVQEFSELLLETGQVTDGQPEKSINEWFHLGWYYFLEVLLWTPKKVTNMCLLPYLLPS